MKLIPSLEKGMLCMCYFCCIASIKCMLNVKENSCLKTYERSRRGQGCKYVTTTTKLESLKRQSDDYGKTFRRKLFCSQFYIPTEFVTWI